MTETQTLDNTLRGTAVEMLQAAADELLAAWDDHHAKDLPQMSQAQDTDSQHEDICHQLLDETSRRHWPASTTPPDT